MNAETYPEGEHESLTGADEDIAEATEVLALALCNSPAVVKVLQTDDPLRRLELIRAVSPGILRAYVKDGYVSAVRVAGALVAVGLARNVFPVYSGILEVRRLRRRIRLGVLWHLPWIAILTLWALLQAVRPYRIRTHHLCIDVLAVLPEHRKRGHGSRLFERAASIADHFGIPAMQISDDEQSIAVAERKGAILLHSGPLWTEEADGWLWFMLRGVQLKTMRDRREHLRKNPRKRRR